MDLEPIRALFLINFKTLRKKINICFSPLLQVHDVPLVSGLNLNDTSSRLKSRQVSIGTYNNSRDHGAGDNF